MQRDLILQWDSTNVCNLSCKHCYHKYSKKTSNPNHFSLMKDKEVKFMLDDLKNVAEEWSLNPTFHISGGEPLLRDNLFGIIKYATSNNLSTRILTNGTLINPDVAKKLSELGINGIQISIDGPKRIHDNIRGKGAYKKAINGITNAVDKKIKVNVSMTAMKSNIGYLEDIIKNSINAGAHSFGFQSYVPNPKLKSLDPEFLDSKETYALFQKTEELKNKYGDKIHILQGEVLWRILEKDSDLKRISREEMKFLGGCSAGYFSLSVLSNGDVYPCRRLPIKIGHISEGIKKLILEPEVMRNLRDLAKLKENSQCEDVTYCRGCRAIAYAVTGDYMAKDPMCFKNLVKLENIRLNN